MNTISLATVVIPTYHRPEQLRQCLESIERELRGMSAATIDVVVSDDSRNARSRELVAAQFPWVRYVEGPRRGPAANRNCGARQARSPWLIFTDDDCIAEPGWLAAYLRAFERFHGAELFEGRTRADRARISNTEESPVNECGGYLWSCNMGISVALYRRMNGFCESFPHPALEDVDLRLRLERDGRRAIFLPDATVCHPFRPSRGLDFVRQHNASYVHLLERHPELRQALTWQGIAADAARLLVAAARNAWRYGLAGSGRATYAALSKTLIDIRFKLSGAHTTGAASP